MLCNLVCIHIHWSLLPNHSLVSWLCCDLRCDAMLCVSCDMDGMLCAWGVAYCCVLCHPLLCFLPCTHLAFCHPLPCAVLQAAYYCRLLHARSQMLCAVLRTAVCCHPHVTHCPMMCCVAFCCVLCTHATHYPVVCCAFMYWIRDIRQDPCLAALFAQVLTWHA